MQDGQRAVGGAGSVLMGLAVGVLGGEGEDQVGGFGVLGHAPPLDAGAPVGGHADSLGSLSIQENAAGLQRDLGF